MPLIVISGYPCSGKTKCANELKAFFEKEKQIETKLISDHQRRDVQKNFLYSNTTAEKDVRSFLKSEVQRFINNKTLLIFDFPNYIKGFRYEMYCVSKSAQTTQCTVHCDVEIEKAREINESKTEDEKYGESVFNELIMKYETPDNKNRWDSPLFTVRPLYSEEIPFEDIYAALYLKNVPTPHISTLPQPVSTTNLLHELDAVTQAVVQEIMENQKMCTSGDLIKTSFCDEKVVYLRSFSLAELQKLRRQFIGFAKTRNIDDVKSVPAFFIQFINKRAQ